MCCVFPTGLSLDEVREYERKMQETTNSKVKSSQNTGEVGAPDLHCTEIPQRMGEAVEEGVWGRGDRMQLDMRTTEVDRVADEDVMKSVTH